MRPALPSLYLALLLAGCGDTVVGRPSPERPAEPARAIRASAVPEPEATAEPTGGEDVREDLPPRFLIAKDARTGLGLADVEVFTVTDPYPQEHPGTGLPGKRVAGPADSPVRIPNELPSDLLERRSWVFARAPGYAFGRRSVQSVGSGDIEVLLEPAGSLAVHLEGEDRHPDTVLRLREGSEDWPFCETGVASGTRVELGSVPVGSYRISVEIGRPGPKTIVLAEAEVEVERAQTTTVRLPLESRPRPVQVPLRGRVVIPPEWSVDAPGLSFEFLGVPLDGEDTWRRVAAEDLIAEGGGVYRFEAGSARAGAWRVRVREVEHASRVVVGREDLRIAVPPPADLRVRIIDATTGRPVRIPTVTCRGLSEPGGYGRMVDRDLEGTVTLRVAAGRTRVSCWSVSHWSDGEIDLDATPGAHDVTLEIRPGALIRLDLKADGEARNWCDFEFDLDYLVVPEHPGRPQPRWEVYPGHRSSRQFVRVEEGGRCRLRFSAPPGYEPIPDAVVEAKLRKTVSHTVNLRRKR